MCGIFGLVGRIDEATAQDCRDRLAHRGPDGSGLWRGEGVVLAHRRLSILDLSDRGSQPMADVSGRYRITFNGELYNFLELRRKLESLGRRFSSDSDTEVFLEAYAQWGPACLDRFNGMWAAAIWDERERTLFLCRDRFGKKPLFCAQTPAGFAFASEMKALFPLLDRLEPHPVLTRHSRDIMRYESGEECLILGITRFPAGHWGLYHDGRMRRERWWCTLDHPVEVPSRFEEQAELFRDTFLDACRLRLRSDVPVGCALSGGLDSSAVLCATVRIARDHPEARGGDVLRHAFTASFPGTPQDETPYARRLAEHLGVPLTVLEMDQDAIVSRFFESMYLFEELHLSMPAPFMLTYGAMRQAGVTVSMDGHGADECFAGYLFTMREALADASWRPAAVRSVLDAYFNARPDSPQFPRPSRLRFLWDFHAARLRRRMSGREPAASRDVGHLRWAGLDHLTRALYVATHEGILPTLLRNYDRYSMANGVEIRMPFLDHRIVSLAFSLPWTSKVRQGFSKAVVRRGVEGLMPTDIAWRCTKIGFNAPVVDWMRGPLRQFFLDEVHSRAFAECGLVDRGLAISRLEGVLGDSRATYAQGEAAWTALAPYFWEQAVLCGRR